MKSRTTSGKSANHVKSSSPHRIKKPEKHWTRKTRQQCQNVIDTSNTATTDSTTPKPKLKGIVGITNGVRLDCHCSDDAQCLRQITDWNNAFKDLAARKPKHGIVVHGVPIAQVTGIEDEDIQKGLIEEREQANDMKIHSIKPLRRKSRSDNDSRSPRRFSIIIFTENGHIADKCILPGFYIDSEHHTAEKYAAQLHITQCFNCYEYGHRAAKCKRKTRCGNCSSEDPQRSECTSTEPPLLRL